MGNTIVIMHKKKKNNINWSKYYIFKVKLIRDHKNREYREYSIMEILEFSVKEGVLKKKRGDKKMAWNGKKMMAQLLGLPLCPWVQIVYILYHPFEQSNLVIFSK